MGTNKWKNHGLFVCISKGRPAGRFYMIGNEKELPRVQNPNWRKTTVLVNKLPMSLEVYWRRYTKKDVEDIERTRETENKKSIN